MAADEDHISGRRIVELQTSLALIHNGGLASNSVQRDRFGRTAVQHPALKGIEGLSDTTKDNALDKQRVVALAEKYGLDGVIRWKPRNVCFFLSLGDVKILISGR